MTTLLLGPKGPRLFTLFTRALVCGASLSMAALSCSGENSTTFRGEDSANLQAGSLTLNLVGTSPSQNVYQLENAHFVIRGLSTGFETVVSSEGNPYATSLLVEVPADDYEVFLAPGYQLNRLSQAESVTLRNSAVTQKFPRRITPQADAGMPTPPFPPSPPNLDGGLPPGPVQPPTPRPDAGVGDTVELISDNPARTIVVEDAITSLDFVFRVGGELISIGTGALEIGIQIEEVGDAGTPPPPPPSGCTDDFEPNNSLETAAILNASITSQATLCGEDNDFFSFAPDVEPGETFVVNLEFLAESGDLDAFLLNEEGEVVAYGEAVGANEQLEAVADGNPFTLQTFLFLSTNETLRYDISIEAGLGDDEEIGADAGAN